MKKGTCQICNKKITITKDGNLMKHGFNHDSIKITSVHKSGCCKGSFQKPAEQSLKFFSEYVIQNITSIPKDSIKKALNKITTWIPNQAKYEYVVLNVSEKIIKEVFINVD